MSPLRWTVLIGLAALLGVVGYTAWRLHLPPLTGDLRHDLQQIVTRAVEETPSIKNCVLAVRRGRDGFSWAGAAGMAHRQSREKMTAETPIFIASVTKLYTAAAVMRLAEKGALTLDDPIAKHLPSDLIRRIQVFDGVDYSPSITIRQLMSHRSGIPDYYDDKADDGKTLFELLKENPKQRWSVDDAIARARDQMKSGFAPGAKTAYSDTNYQLLGKIIEAAAGEPLDVVFANYFFTPLNLKHTWMLGGAGAPADVFDGDADITRVRYNTVYWADGGLVSTAEDMIAFLQALNQGQLVRPEMLRAMHEWRDWRFPLEYGLGAMQFSLPRLAGAITGLTPLWGHSGSIGSFLYYSEDMDVYVAGTVDQTREQIKPFALIRAALNALRNE